jgi:glyoxylase-like metal-dependent hydrolase (beta-lactamase superfamily II)
MSSLERISPSLFRLQSDAGIHGPVNSYLWRGSSGTVLIDPGAGAAGFAEFGGASQLLVTHVQAEHIEGARHFPEAPLTVPRGDEYLCAGQAAYLERDTTWQEPWEWDTRGNFEGHLAGALNERPPAEPLKVSTVSDGELVAGLRVLSTPGHGKHAVTYLAEIDGRRVAFCGDLIYGNGQLFNWFDAEWDYGLEGGQRALLASAQRLLEQKPDILLPSHGGPIHDPETALTTLIARLDTAFAADPGPLEPLNFPEPPELVPGWRQLTPHLYQWKTGNCALLVSRDGTGLVVDDGLCHWMPLRERREHHDRVFQTLKAALKLTRIEVALVTHLHGDHTENIPDLIRTDATSVATLALVADAIEHPERYQVASQLPWYGTAHRTVPVERRLRDGEFLRWKEYEIEAFHLGGQTYYHAGFSTVADGQRVLFVGDAVWGWNPHAEPVQCYNDAEPTERGWTYAADRIAEREADLLVCGHGSAIRDPGPLLKAKQAAWRERMVTFDALNPRSTRAEFFNPFLESDSL